jgi:hypothetical protein
VASFEQMVDVVLDAVVEVALGEAQRAELPVCEGCLSGCLARRMVIEVFPALRADYDRRRILTEEQVRALIREAGRSAAYAHCY